MVSKKIWYYLIFILELSPDDFIKNFIINIKMRLFLLELSNIT